MFSGCTSNQPAPEPELAPILITAYRSDAPEPLDLKVSAWGVSNRSDTLHFVYQAFQIPAASAGALDVEVNCTRGLTAVHIEWTGSVLSGESNFESGYGYASGGVRCGDRRCIDVVDWGSSWKRDGYPNRYDLSFYDASLC